VDRVEVTKLIEEERGCEMTENRQPKAGEWWFSPDGKERRYCVGVDDVGHVFWQREQGSTYLLVDVSRNVIPVPDCTGWDWKLPEMPDGHELCGPPRTISETTWTRRLTRNSSSPWQPCYCYLDEDTTGEFTHCKPITPAVLGPQKEPSSVARIVAQLRQLVKELEELEVSNE
jgi:hypothetical protein